MTPSRADLVSHARTLRQQLLISNPRVSIVVPSRNRHQLLNACVAGIATIAETGAAELIIVDDGSEPPISADALHNAIRPTLIRMAGDGPAAARNAGAAVARGDILMFTDDDTVPFAGWITAAIEYLDSHPSMVGVTGPIRSVAWDPLYEQSIRADSPGHYWTCNVAYRRHIFESIGGFRADVFPFAHAEDRDVAIRAMAIGEIGFAPGMEVSHTPRLITLRDVARQARWARDDLTLYALHPQLTADFTLRPKLALVVGAGRSWLRYGFRSRPSLSIRRLGRALVLSGVAVAATGWTVLRTPSARVLLAQHAPTSRPN
jgi:GT2 family glycosyltransferase